MFSAKVIRLSVPFSAERRRFVHCHPANRVFGHSLPFVCSGELDWMPSLFMLPQAHERRYQLAVATLVDTPRRAVSLDCSMIIFPGCEAKARVGTSLPVHSETPRVYHLASVCIGDAINAQTNEP
jgi:hypothetical protein